MAINQQFLCLCSGKCGRQVVIPPMLMKANVSIGVGGKVNLLCKKCSRSQSYYNSKIKGK